MFVSGGTLDELLFGEGKRPEDRQAQEAELFRVMNKALSNNNNGGSYTFNINNHLDGREIGRQVIKYHNGLVKQYGHSPLVI